MLPISVLKRTFRLTSVAAIAVLASMVSHSVVFGQGLVYVDSDDLFNLEPSAGGSLDDAMERLTGDPNNADNKWRARVFAPDNSFGAAGTVYESDIPEDSPEIKQTITGLSSGTSYDMYAVWWSATNDNWVLRAGLTSNPGGNTVYDRTGAAGTAGQLGVFANWTTPPSDNLNIADGFTGLEAATLEGNRVMLIAKIGTAVADGGGQTAVYFDDTVNLTGAGRAWFDGVAYAPMGANVSNVTATIDRTTGALAINSSADYLIDSITVASGAGALNPAGWSPVTGNLDSGGGFDVNAWETTSMTTTSLAENEVAVGDGATLGPGGLATLNLGNVWNASPFEDVVVSLRLFNSQFTVPVTVTYTGGTPISLGDFDTDGDIDVDDYEVVLRGLNQTQPGLTDLESYALGDVTGDQQTNFSDLARFRDIYDDANGAGAFALLTGGQIPEPSTLLLLCLGAIGIGMIRRASCAKLWTAVALLLAFGVATQQADAQITYVDAIAEGMSTAANGNPPVNTVPSAGFTISTAASSTSSWQIRGNQGNSGDPNNFANNGNALQNNVNTDTAPEALDVEIVTTASGLNPSLVYDIFAFIWDDDVGGSWDLAARSGPSGAFINFDKTTPGVFKVDEAYQAGSNPVTGLNVLGQGTDDFTDYVDGNREMYGLKIGLVSGVTSTDVFVRPSNMTPGERSWYDGIGFAEAQPIPTLEVNTTTGEVLLKNPFSTAVDLSYYEIRSESGSLNPTGWNSLDDQNVDAIDGDDPDTVAGDSLLEGWDEAGPVGGPDGDYDGSSQVAQGDLDLVLLNWGKTVPPDTLPDEWINERPDFVGQGALDGVLLNWGNTGGSGGGSSTILSETNFLGVSALAADESISLGNAFSVGAMQDLTFNFGLVDSGDFSLSVVNYVSSGTSSVATVPEPAVFALLATIGIGGAVYRRRAG